MCFLSLFDSYLRTLQFEKVIGQIMWNTLIMNIVVISFLCIGIVKMYQSEFMCKFFARETDNLEDMIDSIGSVRE